MKYIYLGIFILISGISYSQQNKAVITVGKIDSLYSNILHEQRKIFIYEPFNDTLLYAKRSYPVIYLLDGEEHFKSVAGMLEYLSKVYDNTLCPEMIIVAIQNTDRIRDFTPTYDPIMKIPNCGGGERFTAFMEKELMPFVNSRYPTDPYKMLIGHSFGGLLTINTLLNHTKLFNNYIAIDPSLWWNQQKLMKQADSDLCKKDFSNKSLFVAIANTLINNLDTLSVQKDTLETSKHIRSVLHFTKTASECKNNHLVFSYKYYPDDSHVTVPFIAEYDGLRSIFSWYNFNNANYNHLFDATLNADSVKYLVKTHFDMISLQMGYKFSPPEIFVNKLAINFMSNKLYSKAYVLLKMNLENYPTSTNVYTSLGDYYTKINDRSKAAFYYRKATSKNKVSITTN